MQINENRMLNMGLELSGIPRGAGAPKAGVADPKAPGPPGDETGHTTGPDKTRQGDGVGNHSAKQ